MRKRLAARLKQVAGRLGDDPKMSSHPTPSNNSSSPTQTASVSPPPSVNGFWATLSEQDESPSSSSSSASTRFESWDTSKCVESKQRDVTVILHMSTYGTEEQSIQHTRTMLRYLEVRGYSTLNATHNGIPVESGEPE